MRGGLDPALELYERAHQLLDPTQWRLHRALTAAWWALALAESGDAAAAAHRLAAADSRAGRALRVVEQASRALAGAPSPMPSRAATERVTFELCRRLAAAQGSGSSWSGSGS